MNRFRQIFVLGFCLQAIVCGGIAFMFGLAKEPGLAALWLLVANSALICAELLGRK